MVGLRTVHQPIERLEIPLVLGSTERNGDEAIDLPSERARVVSVIAVAHQISKAILAHQRLIAPRHFQCLGPDTTFLEFFYWHASHSGLSIEHNFGPSSA